MPSKAPKTLKEVFELQDEDLVQEAVEESVTEDFEKFINHICEGEKARKYKDPDPNAETFATKHARLFREKYVGSRIVIGK